MSAPRPGPARTAHRRPPFRSSRPRSTDGRPRAECIATVPLPTATLQDLASGMLPLPLVFATKQARPRCAGPCWMMQVSWDACGSSSWPRMRHGSVLKPSMSMHLCVSRAPALLQVTGRMLVGPGRSTRESNTPANPMCMLLCYQRVSELERWRALHVGMRASWQAHERQCWRRAGEAWRVRSTK